MMPSAAVDFPVPPVDEALSELVENCPDVAPEDVGRVEASSQIETGRFQITDTGLADWALRKLHEARIRVDEIDRQYRQFVAGLDVWRETQTRGYRATTAFFTEHLEDYGRRWIETQPPSRPRSLPLPSGMVKTRTSQAAVVFDDEKVVLGWAKENEPTLVHTETKEWVLISEVRDYVEARVDVDEDAEELITKTLVVHRVTGEIVPGLGVRPKHVDVDVMTGPP